MTDPARRWFFPLSGKVKPVDLLAFDIEGSGGPGGFVCGAIEGSNISNWYTDREEMFDALLDYGNRGYWLFAHNLEYDLPILGGSRFWDGNHIFTASGLLWAEYSQNEEKARFFDSCNLFRRMSIKDLGSLVGFEKGDLDRSIMEDLARSRPFETFDTSQQREIQKYCRRDAYILFLALQWLQEVVMELGGKMRPTIAGIAMDLYRRKFHKYPWLSMSQETNELLRPGYYGGRVENFAYGKVPDCNMFDANSLYPYVQSKARYPHPSKLEALNPSRSRRPWERWEGMVRATVTVPGSHYPPLPYRFRSRLFFPYGQMTGTWTIRELRVALEYGVKIEQVFWVVGSPVTFNPFTRFVDALYTEKVILKRQGDQREKIIKLIMNSLYGRFGLNPEGGLLHLRPYNNGETDGDITGYHEITAGDTLLLMGRKPDIKFPDYVNVMLASQISAEARIMLLRSLMDQGEKAVYCDTDSIITRGTLETGEGLGQWREQMRGGRADLLGPKEYAIHNDTIGTRFVVKGVPDEVAEQYLRTGTARFTRALKVREALTSGKNPAEWVETFRTRHDITPKRDLYDPLYWLHDGYTLTRPWEVEQLEGVCDLRPPYRHWTAFQPQPVYSPVGVGELDPVYAAP